MSSKRNKKRKRHFARLKARESKRSDELVSSSDNSNQENGVKDKQQDTAKSVLSPKSLPLRLQGEHRVIPIRRAVVEFIAPFTDDFPTLASKSEEITFSCWRAVALEQLDDEGKEAREGFLELLGSLVDEDSVSHLAEILSQRIRDFFPREQPENGSSVHVYKDPGLRIVGPDRRSLPSCYEAFSPTREESRLSDEILTVDRFIGSVLSKEGDTDVSEIVQPVIDSLTDGFITWLKRRGLEAPFQDALPYVADFLNDLYFRFSAGSQISLEQADSQSIRTYLFDRAVPEIVDDPVNYARLPITFEFFFAYLSHIGYRDSHPLTLRALESEFLSFLKSEYVGEDLSGEKERAVC